MQLHDPVLTEERGEDNGRGDGGGHGVERASNLTPKHTHSHSLKTPQSVSTSITINLMESKS